MELKLIVLRTNGPERLADFYSLIGLKFINHKHGNSPYHFSTEIGTTIFEIYPLRKDQAKADDGVRLGFSVNNFDDVISKLRNVDAKFINCPSMTEWGYLTVVLDPDGRKVEIYSK